MIAVVLCLAGLASLAASAAPATHQYTSRFDQAQVKAILDNPRVLDNYVKCVTDKGPCTAEGKDIKKILPEVLATNCAKCSPQLRANIKQTVIAMRNKHPQAWEQVVKKYDPKKAHTKEINDFLNS